jgi:CSLREA domain-containing protein
MTHNSDNAVPVGTLPDMPVAWSATNGTMSPPAGTVISGTANSTFTSTSGSAGTACAMVDNQQICTPIAVNAPSFAINDVTHLEGSPSGTTSYVFTVTKTGATALPSSVNFTTVDGTATLLDNDYQTNSGTLSFPASATTDTQQITVLVNKDTAGEPDEAFTVHLDTPVNATISDADGTGTIQNDDTDVSVAVSPLSVTEDGAPNLVYTFIRNGVVATPLTVNFFVGGSATFGGVNGDYTQSGAATFSSSSGTVTFGAGNSTVDVTIDPTADTRPEPNETVTLTLTSGAGYNVVPPTAATGTITDDDPCPTAFTVNNNGDASDANPGDGVCADGGAVCTLRAAIEEANALTACGTIDINFGIGDSTINVGSVLTISHNVNINGPSANKVAVSGTLATPTRVLGVTTGTVAMSNLTIRGARTVSSGSGLRVEGGNVIVSNTLFTDNVAVNGSGGAAGVVSGTLTIINSTISGNTATNGGGLYNGGATLNLINDTITSNSANGDVGGGACGINGHGGGLDVSSASVRNTIIAGNTDCNGDVPNITGSITNQGNNLLSGDPLVGALMDNGGPTFTHGLLYNSPAVDAGNDCVFNDTCVPPLGISLITDQRGLSRKVDGDLVSGAHVDIGAYERQQPESRSVPAGPHAQVDLVDVKLTFTSVPIPPGDDQSSNRVTPNGPAVPATASITVIDPGTQPAPPVGYSVGTIPTDPSCATNPSQAQCLPAFDVSTTAPYTPPVGLCFYLPAITDQNFFNGLKVLHREAGANAIYGDGDDVLVDPGSQKNFGAKIVCTQVSSLSAFVIAHTTTPTASNGAVSGTIVDSSGAPVEGAAVRMSGTQNRLTITDAAGNYHFDNVETNGFYTVVPTRANFIFSPAQRAFSQLGQHTDATFNATPTGNALNPLDGAEYFVRQQYLDFLGREPDEAGFNFWVNNIESCGADANCRPVKRVDTSAAFFLSIEFQQTGYLVYRTYQAAYGDPPGAPVPVKLSEFKPDTSEIGNGVIVNQSGWETVLENNKQTFTAEFVQRPRFTAAYPATMTPDQFVDQLFTNAGVTPAAGERTAAINEFGAAPTSADAAARARSLRRVAENSALAQQEFNRAFVLMQYFGYLRRDVNTGPDADFSGYNFWLNKLNTFGGNFRDAEMVKAFLVSGEYRGRFPR